VRISRLSAENFRNFQNLDLELAPGKTVLFGGNAQGKTNLLEAIHLFATAKSLRAAHERELIAWNVLGDEIPFTRLRGEVEKARGRIQMEVVVQLARPQGADGAAGDGEAGGHLQKRVRVNGVPRRASTLVGEMTAVLFAPQDIELVHGSPSSRRRYLDLTLSQVDRPLFRQLQRYEKVLAQRNYLLKAIREGKAGFDEIGFWDKELIEAGTFIVEKRREAMAALGKLSAEVHRDLAGGEEMEVRYAPSVAAVMSEEDVSGAFRTALEAAREKERYQGMSLVGPHRDDFQFLSAARDLGTYGSRGQQRTAALALKLAQAQYMTDLTGEQPVLLLDDAFSELDGARRSYMLSWVAGWEQSLLTTAEPERVDERFRSGATMLEVAEGRVRRPVTP